MTTFVNNPDIDTILLLYIIFDAIAVFMTVVMITIQYNDIDAKINKIKTYIYSHVNQNLTLYYIVLFVAVVLYLVFAGLLALVIALVIALVLIVMVFIAIIYNFTIFCFKCISEPPRAPLLPTSTYVDVLIQQCDQHTNIPPPLPIVTPTA